MNRLAAITLLLTSILTMSAQGTCTTLEPTICDPHTTTSTTWACNDGAGICCKTKDILYTCYAGDSEHQAHFRWFVNNSACVDPAPGSDGEPTCVTLP